MGSPISAKPSLFDKYGNHIPNPSEMEVGYMFLISQEEPLASGEPIRNPFDVGPGLFDVPGIQNTGIREADFLLLRVEEIHDQHVGTCRIEAGIENSREVYEQIRAPDKVIQDEHIEVSDSENPLSADTIRGAMNDLIKNRQ
jgi:hypothetical protein